jgi:hypothetical protein
MAQKKPVEFREIKELKRPEHELKTRKELDERLLRIRVKKAVENKAIVRRLSEVRTSFDKSKTFTDFSKKLASFVEVMLKTKNPAEIQAQILLFQEMQIKLQDRLSSLLRRYRTGSMTLTELQSNLGNLQPLERIVGIARMRRENFPSAGRIESVLKEINSLNLVAQKAKIPSETKSKGVSRIIDPKTGLPVGETRNVKLVKPEPTGKGSVIVKGASFPISEPQERSLVRYVRGELERLKFDSKAIDSIVKGAIAEANNLNPKDRRRLFELLRDYPRLNPAQRQSARREILRLLRIEGSIKPKELTSGKDQKLLTEGEKEPFELDGRGSEKREPEQLEMDLGPIRDRKTPEQERAENLFIVFIRENPEFRSRFSEFNQFYEWVRTTFNFTDARQVHLTIINMFNSKESRIDLKILIETQQNVLTILKGTKGKGLSEEDLKKIVEEIQKSEARLTGKLKITRDDILRAIEAEAKKNRLAYADFAGKVYGELLRLEGKVDRMSDSLEDILKEIKKDRNLSEKDKKFIESEFTKLSEALRDMESRQGLQANRIEETLRLATESLAKIEKALQSQPQVFENILKRVLAESLANNNTILLREISKLSEKQWKGRYTQILQRFAEVRNLMRDGFKLPQDQIFALGENLIALHNFSSTRFGDLEKIMSEIKDLVGEENLKKVVKDAITESNIPEGVLKRMKEYFESTEYAKVINDALKTRFDNLESKMEAIRAELKTAIEGIEGFTKLEKEALMDSIIHIISEIGETKTLSKESRDMLLELKEILTPEKFKELIKPILKESLEENNTTLLELMRAEGWVKKSEMDEMEARIIEEIKKGKEKEPDKEPDKEPEKPKPDKEPEPEKKKEPETWGKRLGNWLNGNMGMILIIALLGFILWAIMRSKDAATSRISQTYSITPVFGETLKTATTTGSSLLGSLGGINPLIIIGIVAVLFLLFPKK